MLRLLAALLVLLPALARADIAGTVTVIDGDTYGRMIAKCSVAGVDLGEWMVANGWAVAYRFFSYEYTRAGQRAKSARRGIWASEFVLPWVWRRANR